MAAVKDWTFEGTWPYAPHWFDSDDGRMHYVDEGPRDGRPVVMVHGNPTWGYLYRNFIGPLVEAGHRAIVPDHLGFGLLREAATTPSSTACPRHAQRLNALLESLDLRSAVVVPQDWGGPIGLYWATQHPERVGGLFILNTFAHGFKPETLPPGQGQDPAAAAAAPLPHAGDRRGDGEAPRHVQARLPVRAGRAAQGPPDADRQARLHARSTAGPSERTPILVFPREIPVTGEGPVITMTTQIEERMKQHFRSKPVHITWAMKDPAFLPSYLDTCGSTPSRTRRSRSSTTPATTSRRTRTSGSCRSWCGSWTAVGRRLTLERSARSSASMSSGSSKTSPQV